MTIGALIPKGSDKTLTEWAYSCEEELECMKCPLKEECNQIFPTSYPHRIIDMLDIEVE